MIDSLALLGVFCLGTSLGFIVGVQFAKWHRP